MYQVLHFADAFDLLGDLTRRQLGIFGWCGPAQLGDSVVYLDVHPRHLRGAGILAEIGADALFQLFLLLANTLDGPVLLADQGSRCGIRVLSIGAGAAQRTTPRRYSRQSRTGQASSGWRLCQAVTVGRAPVWRSIFHRI